MASQEELDWWNKFADVMAEQWMLTPKLNAMIRTEYEEDYKNYLFKEGGSFLEIGCGTGWIGQYFALLGMEVDGVDFSESQLDIARELAEEKGLDNVAYFTRDLVNEPLAGRFKSYDAILVNAVLHHLSKNEIDSLNSRIADLLSPGGRVYIYEPFAPKGENSGHRILIFPFELLARTVLFTIQRIGKLFGLFNNNFIVAIREGYTGSSPDEKPIPIKNIRDSLTSKGLKIDEERPFHCFSLAVAMSIVRLRPNLVTMLTPVVKIFYLMDRWLFKIIGWQNFGNGKSVLCCIKASKEQSTVNGS